MAWSAPGEWLRSVVHPSLACVACVASSAREGQKHHEARQWHALDLYADSLEVAEMGPVHLRPPCLSLPIYVFALSSPLALALICSALCVA